MVPRLVRRTSEMVPPIQPTRRRCGIPRRLGRGGWRCWELGSGWAGAGGGGGDQERDGVQAQRGGGGAEADQGGGERRPRDYGGLHGDREQRVGGGQVVVGDEFGKVGDQGGAEQRGEHAGGQQPAQQRRAVQPDGDL